MTATNQNRICQTEEVNQELDTFPSNYKSLLAQSNLMDEVKDLVNEKGQYLTGFSRKLVIYDAIIKVISNYGLLQPSIWF